MNPARPAHVFLALLALLINSASWGADTISLRDWRAAHISTDAVKLPSFIIIQAGDRVAHLEEPQLFTRSDLVFTDLEKEMPVRVARLNRRLAELLTSPPSVEARRAEQIFLSLKDLASERPDLSALLRSASPVKVIVVHSLEKSTCKAKSFDPVAIQLAADACVDLRVLTH
ncbi:MAG TPA: hypothetical protein VGM81_09520 [Burkholderiaceae bacterium]|jgi:hypothetical protein